MPRSLPLPVTILLLVILSGIFHTLIRSNLQATTFRTSLQPTSLDDDLDSSASARVSLLLTEAVQRGARARLPEPAQPRAPPALSAADASAAAVEPSDKDAAALTASGEGAKRDRSDGRTPPATSAARAEQAAAVPVAVQVQAAPEAAARESLPAACAAAACAACELRWLHWNLQQRPGRPDEAQLATVLAFAAARRFDVVSLNEIAAASQAQVTLIPTLTLTLTLTLTPTLTLTLTLTPTVTLTLTVTQPQP
jgi:hypothetical protein